MISYNKKGGYFMNNAVFYLKNYGKVVITLRDVMEQRAITRNRLASLTGLAYNTINRYYQPAPITSVDLDILAKICFVLDCDIADVLRYDKP
jgi:putative transcriptional regulator